MRVDVDDEARAAGLRRRDLLIAAGGVAAAVGFGADPASASPPVEDGGVWLAGTVNSVSDPDSLEVVPTGPAIGSTDSALPTRVKMAPGAAPSKEGPVSVSAFAPGERVVAHGEVVNDTLVAADLEPLYETTEAVITSRSGEVLNTTGGAIRLISSSRARAGFALDHRVEARPLSKLAAGDRIVTTGRRDPRTSELLAVLVGTVAG